MPNYLASLLFSSETLAGCGMQAIDQMAIGALWYRGVVEHAACIHNYNKKTKKIWSFQCG